MTPKTFEADNNCGLSSKSTKIPELAVMKIPDPRDKKLSLSPPLPLRPFLL